MKAVANRKSMRYSISNCACPSLFLQQFVIHLGPPLSMLGIWQEKLGVILEKEDEMECLVAGCNFLFRAIYHEAFMFEHAKTSFVTGTGRGKCMPFQSQGAASLVLSLWHIR